MYCSLGNGPFFETSLPSIIKVLKNKRYTTTANIMFPEPWFYLSIYDHNYLLYRMRLQYELYGGHFGYVCMHRFQNELIDYL